MAARRRRALAAMSPFLLPLLGLAVVLGLWWGAVAILDIPAILLPSPSDVVAELIGERQRIAEQTGTTLLQTVLGFAITTVGGLAIGTMVATSRVVDQMVSPWLVAFNAIPKVAFAPLLLVWLGFGMQSRVAMVVLLCFFPIVLATAAGLASTPVEYIELGKSLDASRWQMFRKFRFPNALPHIFVGLKVAMPLAVIGAVIGEFAGGRTGLGYIIQQASGVGNTSLAFASIVVLSGMSIVLFYALVVAERVVVPWVRATTA